MYYNNKDIRIEEKLKPKIGPDELLVKTMACGICGSDVMEWYRIKKAPRVLGHEMTGEIVYTYRGSWCAEGLNTTWGGEWRIIGEKGSVKWDGGDNFQAQVVADMFIDVGIRAILNFSPFKLRQPENCLMENVDFTVSLDNLAYHLNKVD